MSWIVCAIAVWVPVGIYFALDMWKMDVVCEATGHWRRSWYGVVALFLWRIVWTFPVCVLVIVIGGQSVIRNFLRRSSKKGA